MPTKIFTHTIAITRLCISVPFDLISFQDNRLKRNSFFLLLLLAYCIHLMRHTHKYTLPHAHTHKTHQTITGLFLLFGRIFIVVSIKCFVFRSIIKHRFRLEKYGSVFVFFSFLFFSSVKKSMSIEHVHRCMKFLQNVY